jgi:hypothetical protein
MADGALFRKLGFLKSAVKAVESRPIWRAARKIA